MKQIVVTCEHLANDAESEGSCEQQCLPNRPCQRGLEQGVFGWQNIQTLLWSQRRVMAIRTHNSQ